MNATPQNTDATGTANVRRYIGLQAIKWIKVTAPGYESVEVPVSENGPLRVTLQRRAE